jgi:hypothetical protein
MSEKESIIARMQTNIFSFFISVLGFGDYKSNYDE